MAYKSIPAKRKTRKGVHLVLHLMAFLSGILGIYVIFKYKNEAGAQNLQTLHSWLGITTVSLYGLQVTLLLKICVSTNMISGLSTFYTVLVRDIPCYVLVEVSRAVNILSISGWASNLTKLTQPDALGSFHVLVDWIGLKFITNNNLLYMICCEIITNVTFLNNLFEKCLHNLWKSNFF